MDKTIGLIIACEAFKGELEHLKDMINVDIIWIEHSLHNYPDKLNQKIREKIYKAEEMLSSGSTVLLFFGNCGGALEGIKSKSLNLIYPDVHDCIPIIIGSITRYKELHKKYPGTFYLNKAWIDSGEDPLGCANRYIKIYGSEKGWKATKKMFKNYKRFTLIDNGCYDLTAYKKRVKEACEKFEKEYSEEKGSLDFIKAILNNNCTMKKIHAKNERN